MSQTKVADGLYSWTLTMANGERRVVLGSTLGAVIALSSPVVNAVRGAAFVSGPPPAVASLNPAAAALAAAPFTLHVLGSGFQDGCVISVKGTPQPTTFVSATELTTPVTMAGAVVGNLPVSVRSLTGQDSNAVSFSVTAT